MSGIFPAPAYATYHQPFPFFATPPAFSSPIPAQSDPIWPPAVSPPIHGDLHNSPNWPPLAAHPIPAAAYPPAFPYVVPSPAQAPGFSAAPAYHYMPASTAPPATDWSSSPAHHTFFYLPPVVTGPTSQQIIPSTVPNTGIFPSSDLFGPTSHALVFGNAPTLSAATTDPTATPSAEAQACAEAAVLDIKQRLEDHQDQSQCSLDSLQGELYKIRDRLFSLTTSASNTTTAPVGFTPSSGSTTVISTVPAAPSYVAPQLLEEMPQCYGLHDLNRHSLFRANGTEQSYFTLPTDYPLERDISEPVFAVYDDESEGCSIESVHVFTCTPEQLTNEEEQHENLPASKYFSKASEDVIPSQHPPMSATATDLMQIQAFESIPNYDVYEKEDSACLNIILDVRDFSLELQQQDDERACNCPVLKAYDSDVTRSTQLSTEPSVRELRLLWDPGALLPIVSSKTPHPGKVLQVATHAVTPPCSTVTGLSGCKCLPFCSQQNTWVYSASGNGMTSYFYWNPGVLRINCIMLDKCAVPHQAQLIQQTSILCLCSLHCQTEDCQMRRLWKLLFSGTKYVQWDPGVPVILHSCTAAHPIITHPRAVTHVLQPIFAAAIMCYLSFGLGWTQVNASVLFILLVACSKGKPVAKDSMVLSISGNSMTNKYFSMLLMQSLCAATTVHVTEQKHILEFNLMAEMLLHGSKFRDEQLAYMPQGASVGSSKLAFLVNADAYLSRYIKFKQHLSVTSFRYARSSAGFIDCEWMSFYSQYIFVYWESDFLQQQVQYVHQIKYHGPYVWDPGNTLVQDKSIWLLLLGYKKEKVTIVPEHWSFWLNAIHYCQICQKCNTLSFQWYSHQDMIFYGIPTWLISFQVP
jgi:hypothetical protein